jgi:hypothetical protein
MNAAILCSGSIIGSQTKWGVLPRLGDRTSRGTPPEQGSDARFSNARERRLLTLRMLVAGCPHGQAAGPRRVVTSSRSPSSRASEWAKRDIIGESLTMNATKVINHYGNFIVTANIDGTMISAAYLIRWCSPSISPPRAI